MNGATVNWLLPPNQKTGAKVIAKVLALAMSFNGICNK